MVSYMLAVHNEWSPLYRDSAHYRGPEWFRQWHVGGSSSRIMQLWVYVRRSVSFRLLGRITWDTVCSGNHSSV